jgi:urea transport system permease protein
MPDWLTTAVPLFGIDVSAYRIFIFALTVALLAFTYFLITRTRYGFRLRAVTQNAEVARCFGINAARVYGLTFAYGAGLAGVAGALIGPLKSVSPDMGTGVVVDAFMVVVVGGVSTLLGTVASAGLLGEMSGLLAFLYDDTLAKALVFFGVVILIRFRPEGMFTMHVRRG